MNSHRSNALRAGRKCFLIAIDGRKSYTVNMEKLHILLIDDDTNYADVIRHYLKSFQGKSFDLTAENDVEKALSLLRSPGGYDLLLLDYFLPGTNGLEVVKRIRDEKIDVPIVLLTSNRDFRIAIEAMKYGVEDYLIKEEAVDSVLQRTIIGVVERRRLGEKVAAAEKQRLFSQKTAETIQELVVTMCHEFNNPLAAIKISSDIILRQKISEEQRAVLKKLNVNIARLEEQIVKLRDLGTVKGVSESQPAAR